MIELKAGKATRQAYGEILTALGESHPEIIVLDADLSKSTYSNYFQARYPDRFINVGIAEGNMVGIAAGLAASGKQPFASSFATFLMSKGFDQMRQSIAYPNLKARFCGSHAGISIGEDGPSQMGIEDLALACALPGFTVIVPADEAAMKSLLPQVLEIDGPVYIRTGRIKSPVIYEPGTTLTIGRATVVKEGSQLTIATMGLMIGESLLAADILEKQGFSVRVMDFHTLKPIDVQGIRHMAENSEAVLTVEEHLLDGGLGSIIARELAKIRPLPMDFIGLTDYAESGTPEELLKHYGLHAQNIADTGQNLLKRIFA